MHPLTSTNLAFNLRNNYVFALPFSSRTPLAFSSSQEKASLLGSIFSYDSRE